MSPIRPRAARPAVFLAAVLWLFCGGTATAQKMPKPKAPKAETKAQEAVLPETALTAEQADALLASLTDEQARKMLAQALKRPPGAAAEEGPSAPNLPGRGLDPVGALVYKIEAGIAAVSKKLVGLFTETGEEAIQWQEVFRQVSGERGAGRMFLTVLALLAIIAAGLLQRWLFFKAVHRAHERLTTSARLGRFEFLGRFVSNLLLEGTGALIYIATALILFILFYDTGDPGYPFVSAYLTASYYVALMVFAAKVIFAHAAPGIRLVPMTDADASFLFRWVAILSIGGAFFGGASGTISQTGGGQALFLMVYSLAGLFITAALLVMIWKSRDRVAAAFRPAEPETANAGVRGALARHWHWMAALYVIFMGLYWVNDVLTGGKSTIVNLVLSLFVIPIFAGLDQWGQKILKFAAAEGAEIHDLSGDTVREVKPFQGRTDIKLYAPLIRRVFRLVLAAFLFFAVMRLWGLDLEIGRIFTSHVLSIVLTLVLGFIVWEFTKARIDKKLREEMPVTDDDHEEGGSGGSRTGTLLILLRKFIATVLFVVVGLIVLSSLGVNIGPLIAGAGVVGLAIGFGAQTLVKDIIAGIFFLVDDAFRVGDYVEAGSAKGSVEQLSLRSIRLRHPRGMVYTIPFGDLKTVTNYSRDYTITKLDIRVRYDTDLEQVRKIVKRINKKLRKDEEINRVMLDDLKSQGVKEFDDSAMIVRVKFKTLPGEQFALKRVVYKLIQEEFRTNGIEFAYRNVTVYLPPEPGAAAGAVPAAAGAAAAAAIAQAEAEELARAAPKKKE
jgi:small-conductance mechanosensitive channel